MAAILGGAEMGVQQPAQHLHPLDMTAQFQKVPALAMAEGGIGDAFQGVHLFQRFAEQHATSGTIAVEQKEPAVWLARQHALDDRQDRRDAGAGGEADIEPPRIRRRHDAEATGRRHDVELVASLQLVGGPVRERAAIDLLYRDP